jgi:nucleoside-diphosphate-sugar epimerase
MHPEAESGSSFSLSGRVVALTGAGGYVGSELVDVLLRAGARPLRIARSSRSLVPRAGCEDLVLHPAEPGTWELVVREADAVVHLGAVTSASAAESDPESSIRAGPLPMRLLAEAAESAGQRCRVRTVVTAGSATQYGSGSLRDESDPDRPPGLYEEHKCRAESALAPLRALGIGLAFARLANVYGPGNSPSAPDRGVLTRMAERAMHGVAITVWLPGDWLRDYVFIEDAAEALAVLAARAGCGGDGRYLVCSGRSVPLRWAAELVSRTVLEEAGVTAPVEMVPAPRPMLPVELRQFEGMPTRLVGLGWRPSVSLEEGLVRTVRSLVSAGGRACK